MSASDTRTGAQPLDSAASGLSTHQQRGHIKLLLPANSSWQSFLELFALTWLAIAQPILSVFEASPATIVTHRAGFVDIAVVGAALTFGPALLCLGVLHVVGRVPQHRAVLLLILESLLVLFAVSGISRQQLDLSGAASVVVIAAVVMAFLLGRVGTRVVGEGLRTMAIAPVGYLVYFLLFSPASAAVQSASSSMEPVDVERPNTVLFIMLDELPTLSLLKQDGTIDRALYPSLAELADQSTWYRNNITIAPFTNAAVPAILAGEIGAAQTPPTAAAFPRNLFSLLEDSHELDVTESRITSMCEVAGCDDHVMNGRSGAAITGLLGDARTIWWSVVVPGAPVAPIDFAGEADTADSGPSVRMLRLADRIGPSIDPRLYFVHVLLPHQPWSRLPGGLRYNAAPQDLVYLEWDSVASAERARLQHVLQLQRTDELVGELLDSLKASGHWDETLIVLTADHGISFTEGYPARGMTFATAHEVMATPLFVKYPGQTEGDVVDIPVSGLDVLPTIVSVLGIDVDEPFAGSSLVDIDASHPAQSDVLYWAFNVGDFDIKNGMIEVDRTDLFAQLLEAAQANDWGDPNDPRRLFRIGPHPQLIGTPVEQLDIAEPWFRTARLAEPAANIESKEAKWLPAFVHGTLDSVSSTPVAIAVNGTIGLVAETRGSAFGPGEFWGLIPPDLLGETPIELQAYLVEGLPAAPLDTLTLTPIEIELG